MSTYLNRNTHWERRDYIKQTTEPGLGDQNQEEIGEGGGDFWADHHQKV